MIRLVQRQLIIPRGDTGTFSIPAIAKSEMGDASIFTIFDPLKHKKIFEKEMQLSDGVLSIDFTHGDTVNLPVGQFVWDIKFYKNVRKVDGLFVDGDEIDSYYAAFKLPVCEIRQTGDALLSADDAPTSTIAPEQLNVILAAGRQIHDAQVAVAADAAEVTEMKGLTEQMKDTAIEAADTATAAATSADASASAAQQDAASAADSMAQALTAQAAAETAQSAAEASEANALLYKNAASASATAASQAAETATAKAAEAAASAESAANSVIEMQAAVAAIPTRVGEFENDVGYLVENDLASVAMSGDYEDLENKPFIPTRVSDLTDDSGHYIKPIGGIPASDLEETYLTSFTETDPTVPAWAKAAQKPTYTAGEVGALPADTHIPSTTQELTNDAGFITAAALPTKVSDLVDDSGHYTKPVTGIPASDLEEAYTKFTDYATARDYGVVKFDSNYGITGFNNLGIPMLAGANSAIIKAGEHGFRSIMPQRQHESVFYGLAKAAGANLANTENVVVGTYPDNAKTAIQQMLGVPSTSAVTSEIAAAIGNINSFDMSVVQALPTENISTHTIYLVPKTGDTNDVYDEYVYVNNGWEMVGNTQIDLSNYVQKTDYATENKAGLAKFSATSGFIIGLNGGIFLDPANLTVIKAGTVTYQSITPYTQHAATFYGLAKAAGSDEKDSELPLGTYSTAAKSAIRSMIGAAASSDIPDTSIYATKADTVLETTLSRGRKANTTVGDGSIAFGINVEASGWYSTSLGMLSTASGSYSKAEGKFSTASGDCAHAEGSSTIASGRSAHSEGSTTTASAEVSHSEGTQTIASGIGSHSEGYGTQANACLLHAEGRYNQGATIYSDWVANTEYSVGDKVSQYSIGYICTVDNSDTEWNNEHWQIIYHNSDRAFVVGNGTANNARSNAYVLDWDGNGHYMGDVYVGASADSTGGTKVLCEADFATDLEIQNIINGGAGA